MGGGQGNIFSTFENIPVVKLGSLVGRWVLQVTSRYDGAHCGWGGIGEGGEVNILAIALDRIKTTVYHWGMHLLNFTM